MYIKHFTGDTHGEVGRINELYRQGASKWGKNDILFVSGDWGYLFLNTVSEKHFLDEMAKLPYTICFCDGNHENFPAIFAYSCEIWNGGKVHRIRDNIFHLMRGQVYTIDGEKIFTMGGAYSIDRYMRSEGYSYWREELPSEEEYGEAIANLKAHDYRVDYILTHTAPQSVIIEMLGKIGKLDQSKYASITNGRDSRLTNFFEWIREGVTYRRWFFGHWHEDYDVDGKHRALHFDVETVE